MDARELQEFGEKMVRAAHRRRLPFHRDEEEIAQLAILSALETHRRYGLRMRRARTYYFRAAMADITLALARQLAPVTMGENTARKIAGQQERAAVEDAETVAAGVVAASDEGRKQEDGRRARDELRLMIRGRTPRRGQEGIARVLGDAPDARLAGSTVRYLRDRVGADPRARELRAQMLGAA
jgi:hypothetical protein